MNDARERMVQTAARLFQRHGYHAVGFRRIVEVSEAPRGSIYHHFPQGKGQLGAEAVAWSGSALVRSVSQIAASQDDIAGVLEALGERLAGWLEDSDFAAGCPVATVALELAPADGPVTDACRDVFRNWTEVLRDRLTDEGWEPAAASDFATTVVAALEGALLLARVERDATPVRTVARDLAARAR